jgi:putative oxygen-independent coproporphyrinogen III oxidase
MKQEPPVAQSQFGSSFGLYVHWPYCESKCPYCDFNSHVGGQIDADRWAAAYRSELERVAATTSDEILATIFFGGGTPSLMPASIVATIIDTATRLWRTKNLLEVSLEANPGSVEAGRFRDYRSAGVTRISLGIQSLSDQGLRLLGRRHSAAEALTAIGIANSNFDQVSLDLMYGIQHQSVDEWKQQLRTALAFGTGHLSLYQLTIEDGTVFARRHAEGKLRGLPNEARSVAFFDATQQICEEAGLPAYEVSNHAKAEQECRHNLIYWTGGRYAGIGPGAHGRLGSGPNRLATECIRDPAAWLSAVEGSGSGYLLTAPLDQLEQAHEAVLMGLRLKSGIPTEFLRQLGVCTDQWRSRGQLAEEGFLESDAATLKVTPKGRLLLNAVIARLTSDIQITQT